MISTAGCDFSSDSRSEPDFSLYEWRSFADSGQPSAKLMVGSLIKNSKSIVIGNTSESVANIEISTD